MPTIMNGKTIGDTIIGSSATNFSRYPDAYVLLSE